MFKSIAALLAAAVPFALAAQATPPATPAEVPVTPAQVPVTPAQAGAQPSGAKKPYVPHKTPLGKKATDKAVPKKPSPPRPPAPPKKPSNVPPVIYDRHGNAIPTSPDAYDVSSAKKK